MRRYPRVLNADLTERLALRPTRLKLEEHLLETGQAEMHLALEDGDVSLRDFIFVPLPDGQDVILRVQAIDRKSDGRILHLTHGLCTLADGFIPAMAHRGTVKRCMQLLLGYQGDIRWTLGRCDVPDDVTVVFSAEGEDPLCAIRRLMNMLGEGYFLSTDQSGPLWTVSILAAGVLPVCEASPSRNAVQTHLRLAAQDICTRVYPQGAYLGAERITLTPLLGQDYLQSDAAATWGVVSLGFTDSRIHDAQTLHTVAEKYLERHSRPQRSITVQAADLHALTGDRADLFRVGDCCRVLLPDAAEEMYITDIVHEDLIGRPGHMTLTLSPSTRDWTDEMALLRQDALADKLLGGTVTETVTENTADGTATSPVVHYFTVEDGGMLLSVRCAFHPADGVHLVNIRVDDTYLPQALWQHGSFEAFGYLKRDANGLPLNGTHRFILYPSTGVAGELAWVASTVTLTHIE